MPHGKKTTHLFMFRLRKYNQANRRLISTPARTFNRDDDAEHTSVRRQRERKKIENGHVKYDTLVFLKNEMK